MDLSHEWFVVMAKSFGLFWLIGLSIGITIYAFWPSFKGRFDRAAKSILDDEEGPLEPNFDHDRNRDVDDREGAKCR